MEFHFSEASMGVELNWWAFEEYVPAAPASGWPVRGLME